MKAYPDWTHIPIALGVMLACGALCLWVPHGSIWAAAFAGFAVCVMREITQREYQWIEANGGRRAAMPGYQGLLFWQWTRHSLLETLYAGLAALALALILIFA